MSRYTVFDLHEEEALGRHLTLERAFSMACKRAGFSTQFVSIGKDTTLTFTDITQLGRRLPAMKLVHDVPARAQRELMIDAGHRGVWGFFVEPDIYWDNRMEEMRLREARAWKEVPMSDGARLRMMKRTALTDDGRVVPIERDRRDDV